MSEKECRIQRAQDWALGYIRGGMSYREAFMALCRNHWQEVRDLPTGPVWRYVKQEVIRHGLSHAY